MIDAAAAGVPLLVEDGIVTRLFLVRNPDKLAAVDTPVELRRALQVSRPAFAVGETATGIPLRIPRVERT